MLSASQLDFRFGESGFRLSIDAFSVATGEQVAMIGPSGSGKTTLLNIMAGILVPAAGRVVVGQQELTTMSDAARRAFRVRHVGQVFQQFELLEYLDVRQNILLPCRINSALPLTAEVLDRAETLAAEVGVADKLERYPHQLSQGERQRVAICRAILTAPVVILADEPTGNLDPGNKQHVLDILGDYGRRTAATMLTVTHDHSILDRFDRVIDLAGFHVSPPAEQKG